MTFDILLNGTIGLTFCLCRELGPRRQAHRLKTLPRGIGRPTCQFPERLKMCGICGNVAFSSLRAPDAAHLRVKAMLQSLSHRGPDATRQVDTDLAVLGATRLAIRGLTERLNQPIADAESGVIAVCNGEIDNHRELRRWAEQGGRLVQQEQTSR